MEFSNTIGGFIQECTNYKYSQEAYEITKECYEISLMERYRNNLIFAAENADYIANGSMPLSESFFSDDASEIITEAANIKDMLNNAKDKIGNKFNNMKNNMKNSANEKVNDANKAINDNINKAKKNIGEKIKSVDNQINPKKENLVRKVLLTVVNAVRKFIKAVPKIIAKIMNKFKIIKDQKAFQMKANNTLLSKEDADTLMDKINDLRSKFNVLDIDRCEPYHNKDMDKEAILGNVTIKFETGALSSGKDRKKINNIFKSCISGRIFAKNSMPILYITDALEFTKSFDAIMKDEMYQNLDIPSMLNKLMDSVHNANNNGITIDLDDATSSLSDSMKDEYADLLSHMGTSFVDKLIQNSQADSFNNSIYSKLPTLVSAFGNTLTIYNEYSVLSGEMIDTLMDIYNSYRDIRNKKKPINDNDEDIDEE